MIMSGSNFEIFNSCMGRYPELIELMRMHGPPWFVTCPVVNRDFLLEATRNTSGGMDWFRLYDGRRATLVRTCKQGEAVLSIGDDLGVVLAALDTDTRLAVASGAGPPSGGVR